MGCRGEECEGKREEKEKQNVVFGCRIKRKGNKWKERRKKEKQVW